MHALRPLLIMLAAWISLAGCSAMRDKEDLLPQTGPTMLEVYRSHMGQMQRQDGPQPRIGMGGAADGQPLEGYTREVRNEIDTQFKRLPNPDLVMYVFPHLAADSGYPVPGYSTVLPMYDHVEYALPGEAEGWQ